MNCLAEERFVEILDRGGLDATRPDERAHLESCDACRESWATVAAAGEILAEARPKAARGRLVPVLVAAAMLLTIVGVIVWKSTSTPVVAPRDPVVMLLEGTPEEVRLAREALLKQGRKAIPALIAARPKFKGSARLAALQDLIFDLKRAAVQQDPEAVAVFNKLDSMRINIAFHNTLARDILGFIRDFSGLNIYLDPAHNEDLVKTLRMENSTLRSILEVLCAVVDLEFDFKYGVLYFTSPIRLWSTDPAVGQPAKNAWESQVLAGEDATIAAKLRSIRITVDMQSAPLSAVTGYLTEVCGSKFKEDPALSVEPVGIKVSDIRLIHAIQLVTLTNGWDARIEEGIVRIVPRRR